MCLISILAFSQENTVDIIMDGKPAKINVETGVITFTNVAHSKYKTKQATLHTNNTSGDIHIVSKGETLYSISKKHAVSIAQIKSLNNLETNVLSVNQKLKIGYNKASQIIETPTHKVLKGETLFSIAKANNIAVQELITLNNIENNIISIGKVLKLK